jgi:HEPN domain-containing protein
MRCSCATSPSKRLLKGYRKRLSQDPPRVHNLIYLLNKVGMKPPEPIARFIVKLNEASVATRYPEEISKLQKDFTRGIVKEILAKGKETLDWTKRQL